MAIRVDQKPAVPSVTSPSPTRYAHYNSQAMELLDWALGKKPYEQLPSEITSHFERGTEKIGREHVQVTRVKTPLPDENLEENLAEMRKAIVGMGIFIPEDLQAAKTAPMVEPLITAPPVRTAPSVEPSLKPVPVVKLHLKEPPRPGGILEKVLSLIEDAKKAPEKQYTPADFWEMMGWPPDGYGKWFKDPEVCRAAVLFHSLLVLRKGADAKGKEFLSTPFSSLFMRKYKGNLSTMFADAGLIDCAEDRRKRKTTPAITKPESRSGEEVLGLVMKLIEQAEKRETPEKPIRRPCSKRGRKIWKKKHRRHETLAAQSAAAQAVQGPENGTMQLENRHMKRHFWPLVGWPEESNGKWEDPKMREAALLFYAKLVFRRPLCECTGSDIKEAGLLGLLRYYDMKVYKAFNSVDYKGQPLVSEADEVCMQAKGRRKTN